MSNGCVVGASVNFSDTVEPSQGFAEQSLTLLTQL